MSDYEVGDIVQHKETAIIGEIVAIHENGMHHLKIQGMENNNIYITQSQIDFFWRWVAKNKTIGNDRASVDTTVMDWLEGQW
jgi:hypothetical protein